MRIEECIEIERPPEDVWGFTVERANDPRWCGKVESVASAGPGRWNVRHKPVPLRPAMTLEVEQLEAEPPRRLKLREEDEASVFEVEYRLEPIARGTRFTQVSDFRWKKLPRILHGTFRRGVRRDIRAQLRALKRVLEAADPAG